MASGKLASADLVANTATPLYTTPVSRTASFSVNFCNRSASLALVRLALSESATPTADDWVIYDAMVEPNGALERTGLVLGASQVLVVQSSLADVSAVAYGFEE